MLLAAGRGSRLRPLTDATHKVLLPAGERRLLELAIQKLQRAGIHDIIINVNYLAEQIMQHLGDGSRYDVCLRYSIEKPERLDTGGGVRRVLSWLGEEPFWLMSADIWSEYPLELRTLPADVDAHSIMVQNPSFHLKGDYGIDDHRRLSLTEPRYTFANISLLRPQLFCLFSAEIFPLRDVFNAAIQHLRATGELYHGPWFNVGTEVELQQLRHHLHRSAER